MHVITEKKAWLLCLSVQTLGHVLYACHHRKEGVATGLFSKVKKAWPLVLVNTVKKVWPLWSSVPVKGG